MADRAVQFVVARTLIASIARCRLGRVCRFTLSGLFGCFRHRRRLIAERARHAAVLSAMALFLEQGFAAYSG